MINRQRLAGKPMRVWAPVNGRRVEYAVIVDVGVSQPDRFTLEELSTIHRLA